MKTVSYQPNVMRVHDGGKNMCNMNKKRWILVGICIMAVAFALLVWVNMDVPKGEELFLASEEQTGLSENTGKSIRLEGTESIEAHVSGTPDASGQTPELAESKGTGETTSSEDTAQQSEVVVYICGAVKNPGVYQCRQGERVSHAVERAGGLKKNASELVNLAEPLLDGQRVYIPTKKEMEDTTQGAGGFTDGQGTAQVTGSDAQKDSRININTADIAALMTLPGIGQSRAQRILDYRNEHGSFQSIEEIKNISGIKEGLFSQIQELITVQ